MTATDEVIELIRQASLPFPRHHRPQFFERVSELLSAVEILIPERVMAACARAQSELLNAPPIDTARPARPCRSSSGPSSTC